MKGVGKIYQQTFIDTYSCVVHVKLYIENLAITSTDILNDKMLPFYASQSIEIQHILTDHGIKYCGKTEHHDMQLYLGIDNIDHIKIRKSSD